MCPENDSESKEIENVVSSIRGKHLRILVVDDKEDYRKSMGFNLERIYGAAVTCLGSGEEAIARVKAGDSYDLILLDIRMSPMNGVETYRELKRLDPHSHVVMMSAYAGSAEWEVARSLDIYMLAKPIRDEKMLKLLFHIGSLA
jgi:CheY-like chemotaxis protein